MKEAMRVERRCRKRVTECRLGLILEYSFAYLLLGLLPNLWLMKMSWAFKMASCTCRPRSLASVRSPSYGQRKFFQRSSIPNNDVVPSYSCYQTQTTRLFSSQVSEDPRNLPLSTAVDRQDEEEVLLSEDYIASLPPGIPKGFFVVQQYPIPIDQPMDWSQLGLDPNENHRLALTPQNITLPIALMMVNSNEYPTLSRARKACRKGTILIHRGPLQRDPETGESLLDHSKCIKGRVGDRVFPGDVLGKQVRMGSGYFPVLSYKKPPFELPVLYEDDYFALVNKPAGIVVYRQGHGGHGLMTVRAALPFCLQPPRAGTFAVLRRPASVHRLDKPTSGLLCVAKTKPAMLDLSRQFRDRIVQKTYMAIVNGIPNETTTISAREAYDMGVDVDPNEETKWQLIDSPLDEKHAVTIWRAVQYVKSLHANDGYLTLVEMKPKTGRYHQLRRHFAWVVGRPFVGDDEYDGGTESAMKFRERGLFLCSSRKVLEHPFYNSKLGRHVWDSLDEQSKYANGTLWLSKDNNKVMVSASINLPDKFQNLLQREQARFHKFADESEESLQ